MTSRDYFKLGAALVLPQLAGVIGSAFTIPSVQTWYVTLVRPAIAPPSLVFAPVWTTLFLLMGIAAFLVWRKGWNRKGVRIALTLFLVQLVLNTLWSVLFFGLHSIGGALIEISILWVAIVATMVAFAKVSRVAVWLLVPYILWVSFAAYLTYSYWILN